MSTIKSPLFSLDAAGTLNNNITYRKKKRTNIAQQYSIPGSKVPFDSSPRQKDQRSIIRLITIHWQCMPDSEKLSWENSAKEARFKGSGYHYFLSKAQKNLTQYLGLVGYWSMNYNINNKIPDLSGNGNDGILSPSYPDNCPILVNSFDLKQGKAAKFDGINDYINCGSSSLFATPYTISILFLCYFNDLSGLQVFISNGTVNLNGWYFICDSGLLNVLLFSPGNYKVYNLDYTVPLKKYTFIAITIDNISLKMHFYLNGSLYNTFSLSFPFSTVPKQIFFLGSYNVWLYHFNGLLDNILFYNIILSPTEIKKLYESYNLPG